MAGVFEDVVTRADQISAEFFEAFKAKLTGRRQSDLSLMAQSDVAWLMKLAAVDGDDPMSGGKGDRLMALNLVRKAIERY